MNRENPLRQERPLQMCRTPGCEKTTRRLSGRCGNCEAMRRLNGDYQQRAVPRRLILRYVKTVKVYRRAGKDQAEGWRAIDMLWPTIIEEARSYLLTNPDPTHRSSYSATARARYRAHEEIVRLDADAIDGREVTHTVLALFLMRWTDNVIRTDEAFLIQLARAVRKLGTVGLGRYRDRYGRLRQRYRAVPRRAMLEIGRLINGAFGPNGMAIVKAEQQANAVVDPDADAARRAHAREMLAKIAAEEAEWARARAANDNAGNEEDVA
jgi:hypothetical protein